MSTKTQRLVDLLAALLINRAPRTFDQIVNEVPGYMGKSRDTQKRTFERDKNDLREFGVPLETVGAEGADDSAYRLRTTDFYLPYLMLREEAGTTSPREVGRYGYHSLRKLAFEADELAAVVNAARVVGGMGDPYLAGCAESAVRKLAFDLPLDAIAVHEAELLHVQGGRADPSQLDALSAALLARKRIGFEYRSMSRDVQERRTVEPYGLFFLNGRWYLVGRDVDKDELRNFRVSRISQAAMLDRKVATPDYEVPDGFVLREHARSRQSWELGDGDAFDAVVEFSGEGGATRAGAALGEAIEGKPQLRRFRVRRGDALARWILSFAGDAVPLEPPELVEQVRELARATRAIYDEVGT